MNIQSILALTDLSAGGDRALERAARLAAQHRALLKVMHVSLDSRAARADALERTSCAAQLWAQRLGIAFKMVGQAGSALQTILDEARSADLLVVSHQRRRSLRALLLGQSVQQIVRGSQCPVLVIKSATCRPYDRILVAVDFTSESASLAQFALAFDEAAQIELFHALRTSYGARLGYPQAHANALDNFRAACIKHAGQRVVSLTDSFGTRRNRVMSSQKLGDPARQAVNQQQYTNAGLLVIGNRRKSWLMDFLAGSVAQRAVAFSSGDVLVVPHDFQAQSQSSVSSLVGASGKRRMLALLPLQRGVS